MSCPEEPRNDSDLRRGTRVTAVSDSARCRAGERGVIYEVLEGKAGKRYAILFETGRQALLHTEEVTEQFRYKAGDLVPSVVNYRFSNAGRLLADFVRGRFRDAFPKTPRTLTAG